MIAFLVQVAGVALAAGLGASAIWPLAVRVVRGLPAGRRADALVVAGGLPMVASAGLALALIVPTALDVLTVQPDHCHAHDHSLHLCGVHGGVHAPLLVLGAVLVPLIAGRGLAVAARLWRASADLRALSALGASRGALVEVPGDSPLCHAAGVMRPRVLLSAGLRARLGASAAEAAVAHEHAHVVRRDPTALAFLEVASIFGFPGSRLASAFRVAADEAADAAAASQVGAVVVADALVRMARVLSEPGRPSVGALAFGEHPLEQRVALLLAGPADPGKARGLVLASALTAVALLVAALGAEPIHHLVEDLLFAGH